MSALSTAPVLAPSLNSEFTHLDSLRPELIRLGARILGSNDLAEDAVQEAIIALWRQPALPPAGPENLRGWLVHAVAHRALHLRRTRSRRARHESRAARPERVEPADNGVVESEIVALVFDQIAALPTAMRAVVERRVVHELDYAEIADELALPIGTIRSRLHRARQRLAEALGPILHDSDCSICRRIHLEDMA